MTSIKDLVENPHHVFKSYYDFWCFLLNSYEGGIDYCKAAIGQSTGANSLKNWAFKIFAGGREVRSTRQGNLFMHPKERHEDYNERLQMSYYYNFCSPIIDIYTDHMFKQPVNEDFGNIEESVEQRSENIDNKGSSIGEFRKEMADLAQLYGHIFIITDSPAYQGKVLSKADIYNNNLLPYFTFHHPQNMLNWSLDQFGNPYWILLRESLDVNIDPFNFDKSKTEVSQYRLWTREEWIVYDIEYKEINRGVHGLGVVPMTCIFDKQSKKLRNFLGISSIADIAFITRDIYNSCSELKQILRDQTFAFLAIQGEASEYDDLSIGTSKGLIYPENRNPPQYISPPSANAETYFKHIDRQVAKVFQLAKLEGGSVQAPEGQSAIQQSGVSKAWDFNQTNSALSKKAGNLEDGETKLWQVFGRWLDDEFDGSITYPNEFSIQSLNADLDEAEKMARLNLGVEFNKEVKSTIMKKKFPRMSNKDMQRMIDAMAEKEEMTGRGESGRLADRIPSLLRMATENANSGGKNGG